MKPDAISCTIGIGACEKGGQWQLASTLISEMREGLWRCPAAAAEAEQLKKRASELQTKASAEQKLREAARSAGGP